MERMEREEQLIAQYIEPNPHRPGVDEAWVGTYGVPVWALVGHWQAIGQDADQVAQDYEVPREAVEAALAYYRRHKEAIDARIAANVG
ncbi:MAG: DUF433 domain-containing protein [Chloroflexi bacterium]|nr:DUF433 domain-containing protein [Chloroflexota bacterium]